MSNDPRAIGRDIAVTYGDIVHFLSHEGVIFSTEDARAMAISAHIEAGRGGYRSPALLVVDEPPEEGAEQPEAPASTTGAQNSSYGGYREKTYVASEPTKGKLRAVLDKAIKSLTAKGTPAREAETTVKKAVRDAFEAEWNFTPDLTSLKNMNQGQMSWTIQYIQTEWGVE